MSRLTVRALLALLCVASLSFNLMASSVIGTATAKGSFQADHSRVTANATVYDGSVIETAKVPSQVRFQDGTRFLLDANSRGRFHADHIVLERGLGQLDAAGKHAIVAESMKVIPASEGTKARVAVVGKNAVEVAVLTGSVRVANASGITLANMVPGQALAFSLNQGASAVYTITGCLEKKDGRYLLKDETSGVTYEVQGTNLENNVGNRVEVQGGQVQGATPAAGASQVLRATAVKMISRGCFTGAGAAAGGAAAGAAAGAGANKAVIAGVLIAAAVAGTVTAIVVTRDDEKTSP